MFVPWFLLLCFIFVPLLGCWRMWPIKVTRAVSPHQQHLPHLSVAPFLVRLLFGENKRNGTSAYEKKIQKIMLGVKKMSNAKTCCRCSCEAITKCHQRQRSGVWGWRTTLCEPSNACNLQSANHRKISMNSIETRASVAILSASIRWGWALACSRVHHPFATFALSIIFFSTSGRRVRVPHLLCAICHDV